MMNCQHCNKRLSRKTARQIDGVVMCSACMFAPRQPFARMEALQREVDRRQFAAVYGPDAGVIRVTDEPPE